MSATPTLTAIGTETIATSSADIEAIFQSAATNIANTPASDKFTYSGNTLPQGDGKSVLFVPASVVGNVAIPGGYAYVVVAQGSQANLSTTDYALFPDPAIIGDGFNLTGDASVVANGGGPSTIQDAHFPYGPGGSDTIHTAGTGMLTSGRGSSFIIDAGAKVTVDALYLQPNNNHVTVGGGATAKVSEQLGTLNILTGAKTTVSLSQLGTTEVYIGFSPGSTPTVPLTPPITPTVAANAANHAPPAAPVFTNQIVVAGIAPVAYVSHQPLPRYANSFTINDANSVNLIALGVTDSVSLTAGASTVFGQSGNLINAVGATGVFFVGGADTLSAASIDPTKAVTSSNASTIIGGAGNSTVFATAGDVFDLSNNYDAAQANIFVGGGAASTVNANAGGGDFFGGSHGDLFNAGTSRSQIFVGDGGADTINAAGVGVVAPVVYAEGAERLSLVGSAASTVVGFTHGGVINAAGTIADNSIFAGYGISGNQTLTGSTSSFDGSGNAIHDAFVVGANPANTASALTIDNWHAGDVFFLSGFNPYDTTIMDGAIANSLAHGAAGNLTFTLTDNTTISFVGGHPTNYSGNAAF